MYKDHKKGKGKLILVILALLVIGAVILLRPKQDSRRQTMAAIKKSIMDCAVQCYVVEGAYPVNLQYLEDNYGLTVNHQDYYIRYESFAENLPPQIVISLRHGN